MSLAKTITCCGFLWAVLTAPLVAQAQDAADDIRGPKPLVEIPQPQHLPAWLWVAIAATVALAALAILGWWWRARRRRRSDPGQLALTALDGLERSGSALTAEAFAQQAALTVRQFIASRFAIAAPQRTTEEFFRALAAQQDRAPLPGSERLKDFLKSCDLAKFAAADLDAGQRASLLQTARDFVRAAPEPGKEDAR